MVYYSSLPALGLIISFKDEKPLVIGSRAHRDDDTADQKVLRIWVDACLLRVTSILDHDSKETGSELRKNSRVLCSF